MELSKFLFMADKQPLYVVYKTEIAAEKLFFSYLSNAGIENWENEFESAREENDVATFYTGVGRAGEGFENVNCIFFSGVFLLGDDISWENNIITIENVYLYTYEENDGEWIAVPRWHTDHLEINISKASSSKIIATVNERRLDFLFDSDEDDNEFLRMQDNREASFSEFTSEDGKLFTVNWDDLDDLSELSRIWPLHLKFNSD